MERMRSLSAALFVIACAAAVVAAQAPQPLPRPGAAQPQSAPAAAPAAPQAAAQAQPDLTSLGVPLYPTAQFLTSYAAGKGQRYYVFGTSAGFADIVGYYRTQLKERGNLVFEEPPTQMFEVGRFREDTMAFPPSVTIKDWTFGGSAGYPNPKAGATPARFPTIIMIVPAPAGQTP